MLLGATFGLLCSAVKGLHKSAVYAGVKSGSLRTAFVLYLISKAGFYVLVGTADVSEHFSSLQVHLRSSSILHGLCAVALRSILPLQLFAAGVEFRPGGVHFFSCIALALLRRDRA